MAEEQVKIKMLNVSTVVPAIPTVKHSMFLSNVDLFWIPVINAHSLLFYKNPEMKFSTVTDLLKRSLSLVLVDFYPVAGRFSTKGSGETGRPEIDCNDSGVEFMEASIDVAFEDLEKDEFRHRSFFEKLVPARDGSKFENYGGPLLSVQAEEVVTDDIQGAQIFKFMPDDLLPRNGEINVRKSDVDINTESRVRESMNDTTEDLEICNFHFNEEMIGKLKELAGTWSSFVAVSAHFWRCVTRAREVPEKENVDFGMITNCRGRVKPPLPPTFFGNCVCMGFARTRAKQLLGQDIRFAAALIQELIQSCTAEEQFNTLIDWVDCRLGSRNPLASLAAETLGGRYFVGAANSPKFPVYELDYGWGKPVNAQTATLNDIGGMMFFPGRDGGKSIDIYTRLPRQQMKTLKGILMILPN